MRKKTVELKLEGTLEATENTVAVVVRRTVTEAPSESETNRIAAMVSEGFGNHVMVIFLGPNEGVETLSESEMNERGWVRGAVSKDRRAQIRRMN